MKLDRAACGSSRDELMTHDSMRVISREVTPGRCIGVCIDRTIWHVPDRRTLSWYVVAYGKKKDLVSCQNEKLN
jgi:phosphosulfolactate synthase (CoM biosynthesis protein A)